MAALRNLAILIGLTTLSMGWCTAARAESLAESRSALYAGYSQKLAKLADQCEQKSCPALAEKIRNWLPKRDPGRLYLFEISTQSSDDPPAKGEAPLEADSAAAKPLVAEFVQVRQAEAESLFDLAQRAVKEGQPSMASELVQETARENPDHRQARRLLGYVPFHGGWQTPFAVRQLQSGKVWHDKFGWLPKNYVARYQNGDRYNRGRWMTAEEDARLHADIKQGWQVDSDHYQVRTNHSLEEGVQLATRLERLYRCWQQIFMRYAAGEKELARWFSGAAPRRETHQHKVVYFRSREEYNRALLPAQPRIAMTLGIYFDDTQTAYFFSADDQDQGTLFHEATHQLFQETRPTSKEAGRQSNFWIIEGIACYMESLREHEGYWTLGGADAGRMPAARQRLLVDQFYVPLGELTTYGMDRLHSDSRLAKIYSQSAGLAAFLMQYDAGRYREALMGYLEAVYNGSASSRTLSRLAGQAYDELDRQYAEFCRSSG